MAIDSIQASFLLRPTQSRAAKLEVFEDKGAPRISGRSGVRSIEDVDLQAHNPMASRIPISLLASLAARPVPERRRYQEWQ